MSHVVSIQHLLDVVPFMLGYRPASDLVTICTKGDEFLAFVVSSRETRIDADRYELTLAKAMAMGANAVTLALYSTSDTPGTGSFTQSDDELITIVKKALADSLVSVDEFVLVKDGHFTSLTCDDLTCPEREGKIPDTSSELAAEMVFAGALLPFQSMPQMIATLEQSELSKDVKFIASVKRAGRKITKQSDLAAGADLIELSINQYLVNQKLPTGTELVTLVALLQNLQLRDFTLGLIEQERSDEFAEFITYMLKNSPAGSRASVATILAILYY